MIIKRLVTPAGKLDLKKKVAEDALHRIVKTLCYGFKKTFGRTSLPTFRSQKVWLIFFCGPIKTNYFFPPFSVFISPPKMPCFPPFLAKNLEEIIMFFHERRVGFEFFIEKRH